MSQIDRSEKMFAEERRDKILEILAKENRVNVNELASFFKIGEATIRRDLDELEDRGLLRRTHGGALLADNISLETSIKERETKNREAKIRIATFVSQLIRNGETLMIDGGTTTLEVARLLKTKRNLVIITNAPSIADEIVSYETSTVILTGGEFQEKTRVLVGPIAERTIRQFRADKAVLGMSSIIPEEGFFTANIYEATIKKTFMECAKEVIIVMDSSKVGKISSSFISDLSLVDKLIIDKDISEENIRKIENYDIEVITV